MYKYNHLKLVGMGRKADQKSIIGAGASPIHPERNWPLTFVCESASEGVQWRANCDGESPAGFGLYGCIIQVSDCVQHKTAITLCSAADSQ
jgi:hypothetical protein